MKKLSTQDFFDSAERRNLKTPAKATAVLHEAKKYLKERLTQEFFWEPISWKDGVLTIGVQHSAGAQAIFAASMDLTDHLEQSFPAFAIKDIRTKIVA